MLRAGKLLIFCALFLALAAGCAGMSAVHPEQAEHYSLDRLVAEPSSLTDFGAAIQAGRAAVIRVPAGQKLPVHIDVDLPFGRMASTANELEFTREMYLYISQAQMLVSPDGVAWTPITEPSRIKEAFGAEKGTINLGLQASEETGAFLSLTLQAR